MSVSKAYGAVVAASKPHLNQIVAFCNSSILKPLADRFPGLTANVKSIVNPIFNKINESDSTRGFTVGVAAAVVGSYLVSKITTYVYTKVVTFQDNRSAQKALADFKGILEKWRPLIEPMSLVFESLNENVDRAVLKVSSFQDPNQTFNSADAVHAGLKDLAQPFHDIMGNPASALLAIEEGLRSQAQKLPESVQKEALNLVDAALKNPKDAKEALESKWLPIVEKRANYLLSQGNNSSYITGFGANTTLHNANEATRKKVKQDLENNSIPMLQALKSIELFVIHRVGAGKKADGVGPLGGLGERLPNGVDFNRLLNDQNYVYVLLRLLGEKLKGQPLPHMQDKHQYDIAGLILMVNFVKDRSEKNGKALASHYDTLVWNNGNLTQRKVGEDAAKHALNREAQEESDMGHDQLSGLLTKLTATCVPQLRSRTGKIVDTTFLQTSLLLKKPLEYVRPYIFSSEVDSSNWKLLKKTVEAAKGVFAKMVNPVNHTTVEASNCDIISLSDALQLFGYDVASKQATSTALIANSNYAGTHYRYPHEWALPVLGLALEQIVWANRVVDLQKFGEEIQAAIIKSEKPHLLNLLSAARQMYVEQLFFVKDSEKDTKAYELLAEELNISDIQASQLQTIDLGARREYLKKHPGTEKDLPKIVGSNISFN